MSMQVFPVMEGKFVVKKNAENVVETDVMLIILEKTTAV